MNAPDFRQREDRLKPWLESVAKDMLFDELSPSHIKSSGLEFMAGVPVPFTAADLAQSHEKGLGVDRIADNMARVMGADTHFRYNGQYLKYLAKFFDEKLVKVLCSNGAKKLSENGYRQACVYYRAALMLESDDCMAMFGYASCCREWYLSLEGDDETELVSLLKSEAREYFEYCSGVHPDFAPSWYYLGYAYLNQGLYTKSQIVWNNFVRLSADGDSEPVREIKERLESLKDPVIIEGGINRLLAGKLEEGLRVLEPYTNTTYNDWWPLHYYLASAYRELGFPDEAIEGYKKVLALAPSNVDSMTALAEIYAELGDAENAEKYLNKSKLVKEGKPQASG